MAHVPSELLSLLDGLHEPRILLTRDYDILAANAAYHREFGGGREVVGRKCYAVSHGFDRPCDESGESCPLRISEQAGHSGDVLHIHHTPRGPEHVAIETLPLGDGRGGISYFVETLRTVRPAAIGPFRGGMVGRSRAFRELVDLLERAGPSDTSVLLLGESGTGKELAARALHEASPRAGEPFVVLDCSGLPESLFETELFGYEKGAFTGAVNRKPGLIEAAAGGTLFLDEVGDIPLHLQVKLLRLLETGTYRRVGGVEELSADFRLVSATLQDLPGMVAAGSFRRDLYYRLAVFPIRVPPLRERLDDLPLLAEAVMAAIRPGSPQRIHPEAMARLAALPYPGNIRELRNILERALLLADGAEIRPEHIMEDYGSGDGHGVPPGAGDEITSLAAAERRYLEWALARHGGDRRALARRLGISERTLYRKLARAGD